MANGNGAAVRSRQPPQEEEEEENIFLFIPNLIGMDTTFMAFSPADHFHRLRSRCPRRHLSLLHAAPPPYMHSRIQHILPARRPRRHGRPQVRAVHKVWRRARHGDRSLHNRVFARLLGKRLPAVEHPLPGSDLFGSGEPLHAHVCHFEHGREQPES